ncbi:hypothetical protein EK21DRAFT_83331, partial [Setomelanomma holmii]
EQLEGVIDIGYVPRKQLERLIQFLYLTNYDKEPTEGASEPQSQLHAHTFASADQYDVPVLLSRAAERYRETCHKCYNPLNFPSSCAHYKKAGLGLNTMTNHMQAGQTTSTRHT